MKYFLVLSSALLPLAFGVTAMAAGSQKFESVVNCVSAQQAIISIRVNRFSSENEIQNFHDGSILLNGKATKAYVSGSGVSGLLSLTTDGLSEFSLGEVITSEDGAAAALDGGGVMAYNAANAVDDYRVLVKDKKKSETIVMSRAKTRGVGVNELPHLLKCSEK